MTAFTNQESSRLKARAGASLPLCVSRRRERQRRHRGCWGDNSEVLSVRGQLLVLDADALSDHAASLGLERAQLGLERRQALGGDVVGADSPAMA
jgi:hypothetical protein